MKKMLRILALALTLTMALSLFVGCGKAPEKAAETKAPATEATKAPTEETKAPEAPAKKKLVFGLTMPEIKTDGFTAMANGVKAQAAAVGAELLVFDSNNDAQKQMTHFEDFIAKKVDAILFTPVDSGALSEAVKKANAAGIPVVAMDRSVKEGNLVALIESDNVEHGYQAGLYMAEAAKKVGMDPKDLKVLELQGDLATSAGQERSQGFQKAAKELGMTIITSLPTYWDPDKSYNATLDAFQAHPEINAIFEASDSIMCAAVNSALEQIKRLVKVGEKGHIIVTTVDGCPIVIKAIKESTVDASAVQSILKFGVDGIDFAVKAANGEAKLDANATSRLAPIKASIENVDSKDLWANAIK